MALPVIADVFRVLFPWAPQNGLATSNVIHLQTTSTDLEEIGLAIGTAWDAISTGSPFNAMPASFLTAAVNITPLDGVTAAQDVALGTEISGSGSDQYSPATAALVSLHTAQRGARGRGRVYVGPCKEGSIDNGALSGTVQGDMLDGWDQWWDAALAGTPSLQLGVASYVHADFHAISSIRVDTLVATQRRRQDQLR